MGNSASSEEETEEEDDDDEIEDEIEPFDIQGLPQTLFNRIVDKMSFSEFRRLEETSKFAAMACNSSKFSLLHYIPTIYVNKKTVKLSEFFYYFYENHEKRIPYHLSTSSAARLQVDAVCIRHRINGSRLRAVAKLFEKNKTNSGTLFLTEHIVFEPEDLAKLVKVLKTNHLECVQYVKKEFLQNETLQKIERLNLLNCGVTDEEFLRLKSVSIYLGNDAITARGINRFLKQWKKGEREIFSLCIEYDSSFNTRSFDLILEGLDANPIWTPQLHGSSIIANIKLEDYLPMTTGDPPHLYSIFRSYDVQKFLILQLTMSTFEIIGGSISETEQVYEHLTEDQFYDCTGSCTYCAIQHCIHRRKYSIRLIKKAFPRLWDGLMLAVRTAKYVSFVARTTQIILGAPRPSKPVRFYDFIRILFEEGVRTRRDIYLIELRLLFFNY